MVAVLADIPQRPSSPSRDLRLVGADAGQAERRAGRPSRRRRPSPAVLRRRRLVAATVVVVVAVGVLFAMQAALAGAGGGPLATAAPAPGPRPAAAHAWVVQPGDTLWSIALAAHPHGDVRPIVDRLSAEVHGRPLLPGQQIMVP